jgi:hypothetical protein
MSLRREFFECLSIFGYELAYQRIGGESSVAMRSSTSLL